MEIINWHFKCHQERNKASTLTLNTPANEISCLARGKFSPLSHFATVERPTPTNFPNSSWVIFLCSRNSLILFTLITPFIFVILNPYLCLQYNLFKITCQYTLAFYIIIYL